MSSRPTGADFRGTFVAPERETHFELESAPRSEEILMEGDESEIVPQPSPTQKSRVRYVLNNRAHAWQTEIALFEDGWLSIRHHSRHKSGKAQLINLRFVDPQPSGQRYTARKSMRFAIGFLAASVVSSALAYLGILTNITIVAAVCAIVCAAVSFGVFVHRTQERFVFHTKNGRAPVIMLFATLGSFRACRRLIPRISAAIKEAQSSVSAVKDRALREEMREHYRLAETGVLSREVCTHSTKKILAQFD